MRPSFVTSYKHVSSSVVKVLPEVLEAISSGKPVVALESTILAHGLPNPENINLAKSISKILRSKGVIPATVAIKDGYCRVGLTEEELNDLAMAGVEKRADKCTSRDLPLFLAREGNSGRWGATTVASTMRLAHYAGISTFVTGGTGGVHRGGEITMDVSSDLTELARTPIVVVSAGVKSILDISRTLETLETFGVPTVSFGTDDYPAFFSPSSGVPTPARVDSAHEVARAYWATQMLGMTNGMLVAVPNMDPAGEAVEQAIQETLVEADAMGIQGRDVTPYILKRVSEKTGGDSLRSNTSLVKNNARVGADIAISIAEQSKQYSKEPQKSTSTIFITSSKPIPTKGNEPPAPVENSRVVVMGGSVVDLMAKPKEDQELIMKTSNPGYCIESDGGVGRNIAEVLARLNTKPILYSAVGDDSRGGALLSRMKESYDLGEERQCISVVSELNTATYLAVLNEEGDLHTAVADMDVLADIPVPHNETLSHAEFLILDANPSKERLVEAAQAAKELNVKVCFEPTSVPKASLVRNERDFMSTLNYAFPNLDELLAMANVPSTTEKESLFENEFERLKLVATAVLNKMSEEDAHLVITLGSEGVFLASRNGHSSIIPKEEFIHFPVTEVVEVENSTGAGDTLVGGFVAALLDDRNEAEAVQFGMECACKSLKCFDHAISPHF